MSFTITRRTTQRLCAALLGFAAFGPLVGCAAATVGTTNTEIESLIAAKRVKPPSAGMNTVYVLFEDRTAEFADRQYEIEDKIMDAVEANGWQCVDDFDSSQYVLWATVRVFGEGGSKVANERAAKLGGVAGGAVVAAAVHSGSASGSTAVAAGVATTSITTAAIEYLTRENSYHMIVDLMLGQKVNEAGVNTRIRNGRDEDLDSSARLDAGLSSDSGGTQLDSSETQDIDITKPHLEMETRLAAVAKGRRLEKSVARDAFVPKLIHSIQAHLPRAGRRNR